MEREVTGTTRLGFFLAVFGSSIIYGILAFLALLPMLFYSLNEFTLKEIREQKKERAAARS